MFHSYTQSSFWMVSSKGVMSMPFSTSTFVACSSWGKSCNHLDNHGSWQLVLTISGSRCFSLARIQANSSLIAPNKKSWEILKIEKCINRTVQASMLKKMRCHRARVDHRVVVIVSLQDPVGALGVWGKLLNQGLRKMTKSGSEENN